MNTLLFCMTCKKELPVKKELRSHPYLIRGETICVEEEVYVCPVCGEELVAFKTAEKSQEKAYAIYRERKGLLSPKEIRAIRQKYGLSQGLFARILGLGEKTITRYENGYLPDLAQSNLIRLVENSESLLMLWSLSKPLFTDAEQKKVEIQLGIDTNYISDKEEGKKKTALKNPDIYSYSGDKRFVTTDKYSGFLYSWYKLKHELLYKNRYFPENSLLNDLHPFFKSVTVSLPNTKDVTFYRAREKEMIDLSYEEETTADYLLFHLLTSGSTLGKSTADIIEILKNEKPEDSRIEDMEHGFYGHNAQNSSAPFIAKIVPDGRANPELISYLYLAEDPSTAIAEISPVPSAWISVGLFKVTAPLKLVDLSDRHGKEFPKKYMQLSHQIAQSFSKVAKYTSDYYITQYISEFIKKLGYDGIIYNSSKCSGKVNLVIFCKEKVVAVGSELYEIDSVHTTSHKVFPLERQTDKLGTSDLRTK